MSVTLNTSTSHVRTPSSISVECGGHSIELEVGRIGLQAPATVYVRSGDTAVLVPLVALSEPGDANFLPLSVHYHKRNYADGHIPGSRGRREGRPSDAEILVSRLIDRPLRAVFPKGFYHEVQISPMVVSSDPNIKSDILAMLGASTALALSGLPTRGAIAAVRVGYIDKTFVLNPTQTEMEKSDLDLVIAGTQTGILMVEAEANAFKKEAILEAILLGYEKVKELANKIKEFAEKEGKPQWAWQTSVLDSDLKDKIHDFLKEELQALHQTKDKLARKAKREALRKRLLAEFMDVEAGINANQLGAALDAFERQYMKKSVLTTGRRLDGRDAKTIRSITIETDLLPRVHGSALFTRGETQVLATMTLGSERDGELVEGLDGITRRDPFMLHYNFPPYCVGEVGQVGSPKRREIGHAYLAKRAMRAVLPNENECPHVLRAAIEVMKADGSTSQATICGTSVAMMCAGVPLKTHVAGIAMGLVKEGENFVILSDISEDEDHIGDMDLKVAGTRDGITALQLDIKTDGITREILALALTQAQEGLNHILDKMESAIAEPRQKVSDHAPQVRDIMIPIDKIQALIGKGGSTIRTITEETGTLIDIHRDTGLIRISTSDAAACERAVQMVTEVTETGPEVEIGSTYEGVVVKLLQSGAIVSLLPGRKGFLHISQALVEHADQSISDVLKEKQRIMVKVLDIERQTNKIRLTMKGVVMENPVSLEAS